MFCNACGTANNDDSRFCFNCGAALLGASPNPQPAYQQPMSQPYGAYPPYGQYQNFGGRMITANGQPRMLQPPSMGYLRPMLPPPQPGFGTITLFTPPAFIGSVVQFTLELDNMNVGRMGLGETKTFPLPYGCHMFNCKFAISKQQAYFDLNDNQRNVVLEIKSDMGTSMTIKPIDVF